MSSLHSQVDHKVFTEYGDLMDEDATLATFIRMLVEANDAWPRHPYWHGHDDIAVAKLKTAGLVIIEGKRYTIRGLDKRRQTRRDAATAAARAKHAIRTANRTADSTLEPESEVDRDIGIDRGHRSAIRTANGTANGRDSALDVYLSLTAKAPSPGATSWLNRLTDEHDEATVCEVMGATWAEKADPSDFLGRVQTRLAVMARDRAQQAEAKRRKADEEYQRKLADREAEATPEEIAEAKRRFQVVRDQLAAVGKAMP
jgi:hypothetical protein